MLSKTSTHFWKKFLRKAHKIHAVNFKAGKQARLLTVVFGSVAAKEQANSIQLNKDLKDLTNLNIL